MHTLLDHVNIQFKKEAGDQMDLVITYTAYEFQTPVYCKPTFFSQYANFPSSVKKGNGLLPTTLDQTGSYLKTVQNVYQASLSEENMATNCAYYILSSCEKEYKYETCCPLNEML